MRLGRREKYTNKLLQREGKKMGHQDHEGREKEERD